jgi:hypothetical protein
MNARACRTPETAIEIAGCSAKGPPAVFKNAVTLVLSVETLKAVLCPPGSISLSARMLNRGHIYDLEKVANGVLYLDERG